MPKIAPQPGFLRRAAVRATHGLDLVIGVQHHDVPVAQIVTVVAFAGGTSLRTPIFEITDGGAIAIFVISQCGLRAVLEPAPGLVIAVPKLMGGLLSRKPDPRPGICSISLAVAWALWRCWQLAISPAPTRVQGSSGLLGLRSVPRPLLLSSHTSGVVGLRAKRQGHGKSEARDGSNSRKPC